MNNESYIATYLIYLVIASFVGLIILRLMLSIPTFLKQQRVQIKLLEKIAEKQGISSEDLTRSINEIMNQ